LRSFQVFFFLFRLFLVYLVLHKSFGRKNYDGMNGKKLVLGKWFV
jgi:hypothetical protein